MQKCKKRSGYLKHRVVERGVVRDKSGKKHLGQIRNDPECRAIKNFTSAALLSSPGGLSTGQWCKIYSTDIPLSVVLESETQGR